MNLEIEDGIRLIEKAMDEEKEEKLFQRWIPFQSEMPYDEFKRQLGDRARMKLDTRSTEEILMNARNILNLLN